MKRISAYEIALSALACAFATIFLTVGVYSSLLLFTGYLFACLALMLPLAKNSIRGYVFAYVATCILSLIFGAARFFDLLPFIVFFGLHPLVNELQVKYNWNRIITFGVKALWFDGAMYLIWRWIFEATTTIPFIDQYFIPILLVMGTAFFFFYDYVMFRSRLLIQRIVKRIKRK